MLAIWKAGCAYVPLDVAYPKDRLEAMLLDSGAAVLLTSAGFALPESQAVPLLLEESKHPTVDSLARHLSQVREPEEGTPEPLQEARDRATRARATRAAAGPDRFLAARRRIQQQESREVGYDAD